MALFGAGMRVIALFGAGMRVIALFREGSCGARFSGCALWHCLGGLVRGSLLLMLVMALFGAGMRVMALFGAGMRVIALFREGSCGARFS